MDNSAAQRQAEIAALWDGISFDLTQIMAHATALINLFMPFFYLIGGVTVFTLVIFVLVAVARRSSS